MIVRTRFAPSPTGYVHIGGLRTMLYAYLWARKNHGQYIVRVEDTDRTRLVEGAVDAIFDLHEALGLIPDEGARYGGEYGPYIQSDRIDTYAPALHQMCADGHAYYCFCTSERLSVLRQEQEELHLPTGYDGHCRHLPFVDAQERIKNGEKYVIRLKVPKGETIIFQDIIRGRIEFQTSQIEDAVLLKSDGFPTYHGAVVLDDHAMQITHVMRGEEWISSIPIQVLTARALGIELPEYAHLPNVLGSDGKKLSKRTGDVSVAEYLRKGYLPDALLNFLSLLGWHPKHDNEIMTIAEMIDEFEIADIHKAGAVLDPIKLDWMNGEYIKRMSIGDLHAKLNDYLTHYQSDFYTRVFSQVDYNFNEKIIAELQTRMKRFDEYEGLTTFLYGDARMNRELLVNPKMKITSEVEAIESLQFVLPLLENADFTTLESLQLPILDAIRSSGRKNGAVLWPLRVALSGEQYSPGAFELAYILGRERTIERVQHYL